MPVTDKPTKPLNLSPCPKCGKRHMSRWVPIPWHAGNNLKSTCASCGTVEMRWAAKEGELR